jgi:hypothetical protein
MLHTTCFARERQLEIASLQVSRREDRDYSLTGRLNFVRGRRHRGLYVHVRSRPESQLGCEQMVTSGSTRIAPKGRLPIAMPRFWTSIASRIYRAKSCGSGIWRPIWNQVCHRHFLSLRKHLNGVDVDLRYGVVGGSGCFLRDDPPPPLYHAARDR